MEKKDQKQSYNIQWPDLGERWYGKPVTKQFIFFKINDIGLIGCLVCSLVFYTPCLQTHTTAKIKSRCNAGVNMNCGTRIHLE